ncbi:hypothetical protein ACFQ7N_39760 [Streptomyces niveus]|uniref:hypothetical protein n=1 Tax=Streptomyces niveus TaxID=193462 RepID=UPI0036C0E65E
MTETEAPPATLDTVAGLPPACCPEGRALMAAWVDAFARAWEREEPSRDAIDAEIAWTRHQIVFHRLNPPRVPGCTYCAEWEANLELGPEGSPDLDHPVGFEAAVHAVRHQVLDPLVKHHWNGKGPI